MWNIKDLESNLLIGSTLVEGSTLSEKNSRDILKGKTLKGHSIQEVRELTNYRSSVEYLIKEFEKAPYISKDLLLSFHKRLFSGFQGDHGQWKRTNNYTYLSSGSRFDYLKSNEIDSAITNWITIFNRDTADGLILSTGAQLYYDFMLAHPFDDGNGRIGRVLIAYWFHLQADLTFHFYVKDKIEHLSALEEANINNIQALETFFKKRLKKGKK